MLRPNHTLAYCAVLLACASWNASRALPQDMSVYTTVSVIGDDGQPESVGRSLTLFHAGKVYDYMEDAGELVVLEPQAARFVIVNGNYTGTRVEFSELNQFLKVARTETEACLAELEQQATPGAAQLQAWLRFQLEPQFEQSVSSTGKLTLRSPVMTYDVQTAPAPEPEQIALYADYADRAAQLNFVLHPGSSFPAPRLALNDVLRHFAVLPTSVELVTKPDKPMTLRAKHLYQWKLESADKQHIHQWQRLLESKQVRWVGFHEYQQRLVADAARRSK